MESLPEFRYHGAPFGLGMIEDSDVPCSCCGLVRGFGYSGSLYGPEAESIQEICPWCIADGSAFSKLGLAFNHADQLPKDAHLSKAIMDELFHRTPGFPSWQGRTWPCHCEDVCRFMGDLSLEEANNPDWKAVERLMADSGVPNYERSMWNELIANYEIADPSIFKFICLHCGSVFYQIDAP